MRKVLGVVLIFVLIFVICTEARYRRRNRKHKHAVGHRRRVVNNDDDDRRPKGFNFRWSNRNWPRVFRPWKSRFNFGWRRWFDFDLDFDFSQNEPWYEGPNVCTYKDVIKNETSSEESEITSHHVIKSEICDDRESSYKCTRSLIVGGKEEKTVEIRECCPGFTRKTNQYGCPTVAPTKDLLASAKDLNLTKFLDSVKIAGLEDDLKTGNVTLFAPADEGFDKMSDLLTPTSEITLQDTGVLVVSQPLIDTMVSDMKAILLGHVSPVIYTSSRLNDEQLIDTDSPYKSKIRINFYDKELMTANCIKVKTRDTVAKNGVIHVVEKVIDPVTKNLLEIISSDPEMSYLKTAIGRSGLGNTFREEGQFTLFAPSNTAFGKLDPMLLSRILSGDKECLIKLLKNHVLPNVICSHAIQGRAKSRNLLNHMLNLTRNGDDKLFIDRAQAVDMDVMATNGVLYIIDEVLVPDEALDILEIAKISGASAVADLIVENGLAKTLQTTQNLTFFAPSNEAISAVAGKLPNDTTEVMKILTYHLVPSIVDTCYVYNGALLNTLNGDQKIRFNEYLTSLQWLSTKWNWETRVQCASIIKSNIKACNGIIYIVDKVLIPPAGKLLDVLASDSRFSELVQLIKIAEIGDLLEEEGPFTMFAPTNDAFKLIDDEKLEKIVNDKEALKEVLLNHVYKGQLCCSSLPIHHDIGPLTTLSKNMFNVRKLNDRIRIGSSEIEECDLMANNGIIHVLNEVLYSGRKQREHSFRDMIEAFNDFQDMFD